MKAENSMWVLSGHAILILRK